MEKDKESSVVVVVIGNSNIINIDSSKRKKRKPFFQKLKALVKLIGPLFVNVVVLLFKMFTNVG